MSDTKNWILQGSYFETCNCETACPWYGCNRPQPAIANCWWHGILTKGIWMINLWMA